MQVSNQSAKIVLISIFSTILVLLSLVYLVRHNLVDYLQSEMGVTSKTIENNPNLTSNKQIVDTIETVNPAVVSVVVTKDVPVYERYYETYNNGGIFGSFSIPRIRERGTEAIEVGGGSGFIVSNDGLIVTNKHVVEDESARYSVLLNDGTSYQVTVLARDIELDIAILKIDEPLDAALTPVLFGDSGSLKLGESVIAIGNALGEFRNSVSVGVVSGLSRSIVASDSQGRTEKLDKVIQTDAAINPGNSGGPLLNVYGKVIGVNVATSKEADNVGFALPGDAVKVVVDSVKKYGRIVKPSIGVRYAMITEQMAQMNSLPVSHGALLVVGSDASELAVLPGSPAESAGLKAGDIILSVDGEKLGEKDLATILRKKEVGQSVELELWREDEIEFIKVVLGEL